jgi:beta-RFAP synthase
MFGFGRSDRPQFGGVGAMIEPPCIEVEISPADTFTVRGALPIRTQSIVELVADRWNLRGLPRCEIMVRSPRDHTGLGVGTQISLTIATGLRSFLGLPATSVEELSATVGRGGRSAVGTFGFQLGGLIVDAGKDAGQAVGRLAAQVALPDAWRFVLFCEPNAHGLAGASEVNAFERLREVPDDVTRKLWEITEGDVLPAVRQQDCRRFGDAIYRFGRLAGECFDEIQNGPFASERIERLVNSIREFGVSGAGQSSWGPTVFAVTNGDEEAQRIIDFVRARSSDIEYEVTIARPNNCGATVQG